VRGFDLVSTYNGSNALNIAYLLLYGALPTKNQFAVFEKEVLHHGAVHSDAEQFFRSFRYGPASNSVFGET
jgi:citrate synthase